MHIPKNNSEKYINNPNYLTKIMAISLVLFGILNGNDVSAKKKIPSDRLKKIYHKIYTEHRKPTREECKEIYPRAYPERKVSPLKYPSNKKKYIKWKPNMFSGGNEHTQGNRGGNQMPQDKDNDGILDANDKCPDEEGLIELGGCPDKDDDGDGIMNLKDLCPETGKGKKVDEYGCTIDSDGDGLSDTNDKCPDEEGLIELGGCPDKDDDGDGIMNLKDLCPETGKGKKIDEYGCPFDSDGDGYPDDEDLCPEEYGPLEYLGCPDLGKKKIDRDFSIPRGQDIDFKVTKSGDSYIVTVTATFPGEVVAYIILLDDGNILGIFRNGGEFSFEKRKEEYKLQVVPYVKARGNKQRFSSRWHVQEKDN